MIRPDFSSHKRPAVPRGGNVVLGLGLACAAWSGFGAWNAWSDRREARASLDRLQSDPSAAGAVRGSGERDAAAAKLQRAVLYSPAAVVATLVAVLPADARFGTLGLAYDAGVRVDLGLSARTAEAYDATLERLVREARIEEILPAGESRSDEVEGRVRASFRVPR